MTTRQRIFAPCLDYPAEVVYGDTKADAKRVVKAAQTPRLVREADEVERRDGSGIDLDYWMAVSG